MLVVIAGAGAVGQYLLEQFDDIDINIILIEKDEDKVRGVKEHFDALLVEGDMLSHFVLHQANVAEADLFIACSNVDSANILSCQMAKRIGAKKCIARVYSEDIFPYEIADLENHLGVDWLVSPSRLTGYKIAYSMIDTENIMFDNYFSNRLDIAKLIIERDNDDVRKSLKSWTTEKNVNFIAAYRGDKVIESESKNIQNYIPQTGDVILISGVKNCLPKHLIEFSPKKFNEDRKIYFAGTSKSALSALSLMNHKRKNIVVLEPDLKKAKKIEEKYEITVFHMDPGVFKNLENLHLDNEGIFVCASKDDANNLTYALNALDLGFQFIIPIVQSKERVRFFEKMKFENIISPCELAAKEIFHSYKECINENFELIKGAPAKAFIHEITPESPLLEKSWPDWKNKDTVAIASARKGFIFLNGNKEYKSSEVGDKILFCNLDGNSNGKNIQHLLAAK